MPYGTCSDPGCGRSAVARGLCQKHYLARRDAGLPMPPRLRQPTELERFWAAWEVDPDSGCWLWKRHVNKRNGYAYGWSNGGTIRAHKWAHLLLVGPIPEGYQLDHLCHDPDVCQRGSDCPHRRCVNPVHLAVVTAWENTMRSNAASAVNSRKTHCKWGHPFTGDNLRFTTDGFRVCVTCARRNLQRARAKELAAAR